MICRYIRRAALKAPSLKISLMPVLITKLTFINIYFLALTLYFLPIGRLSYLPVAYTEFCFPPSIWFELNITHIYRPFYFLYIYRPENSSKNGYRAISSNDSLFRRRLRRPLLLRPHDPLSPQSRLSHHLRLNTIPQSLRSLYRVLRERCFGDAEKRAVAAYRGTG